MTPYDDRDLGLDWSSVKSSGINIREISHGMPKPSITKICLKITCLRFHSNFPGANELRSMLTNNIVHTWLLTGWWHVDLLSTPHLLAKRYPIAQPEVDFLPARGFLLNTKLFGWRRDFLEKWYSFRFAVIIYNYLKISYIRRTKSQKLNASHLVLQLSLCNIMKPGVKSRMEM